MADVDPTAPGGMSEKALVEELATEHGWALSDAKALKWAAKIDAVVQGRLAREAEAEAIESMGIDPALEPGDEVSESSDTDDLEDLLAEFDDEPEVIDLAVQFASLTEEEKAEARANFTEILPLFIGMPDTKDYIFDGHRGAGPSAAERWMACTASLGAVRAFLETLTPNQQAEFAKGHLTARQGTTAHAVAEVQAHVLLGQVTPEEAEHTLLELAVMPETEGEAYDDTMAEYVAEYVDFVKSYVDDGREVWIEERVTATIPLLTFTDGEQDLHDISGQADLVVVPTEDEPVLVVGDLKYGEGIDVDPDKNPQVRIYALGVLAKIVELYDGLPDWLTTAEYVIIQPRLGGIKVWTESIDDLLDWQEEVLSKALTEALGGQRAGATFVPGDVQCQWCPARGGCPALIEDRMDKASGLFDVIIEGEFSGEGFPETTTLDSDRLADLYSQITGLTKIAADLKEELQRRLYRGQPVPGYVLLNYQPPRKWKEAAAEDLDPGMVDLSVLSEDQAAALWQHKLVTPTAAEKLLGDEYAKIEALVDKPDKRPVIGPEGDRRSKWEGKAPEAMFSIEDGVEDEA